MTRSIVIQHGFTHFLSNRRILVLLDNRTINNRDTSCAIKTRIVLNANQFLIIKISKS